MTKHTLIASIFIAICMMSCEHRDIKGEIAALETQLANAPDDNTLAGLAALYQEAVDLASSQEEKIKYRWKTGETARALKRYDEAEKILRSIYEDHPQSAYASKALFLHAFMLDEDKDEHSAAKDLYVRFIETYPSSDFHDDATFLLQNLGKSDEEILRTLTEKAQSTSNQ
ncbi:MAG: tetratricopeptide repeat protein [Saprospiraceae bacterium]|nr:tetratricopeptide repeat protein [Saprospiraceae bacterium]